MFYLQAHSLTLGALEVKGRTEVGVCQSDGLVPQSSQAEPKLNDGCHLRLSSLEVSVDLNSDSVGHLYLLIGISLRVSVLKEITGQIYELNPEQPLCHSPISCFSPPQNEATGASLSEREIDFRRIPLSEHITINNETMCIESCLTSLILWH